MAELKKITQVVYIYDKGNEELSFADDSWKWGDGFNEEEGDYYYEHTMPYVEDVPIHFYVEIGRAKMTLEMEERGLDKYWLSNSTKKSTSMSKTGS